MYITFEEYTTLYRDIAEDDFARYEFEARQLVDIYTTGVDNVVKLRDYMPTDEYDLEKILHCMANVIHELYCFDKAKNASGYIEREDGSIMGKTLNSVSSGSESMSFTITASVYEKASTDESVKQTFLKTLIVNSLRNVHDLNGVNVLYMGWYPNV